MQKNLSIRKVEDCVELGKKLMQGAFDTDYTLLWWNEPLGFIHISNFSNIENMNWCEVDTYFMGNKK